MQTITTPVITSTDKIESTFKELHFELEETARVQGKHDAEQTSSLTEAIYGVRFLDTIVRPAVQNSINIIREELLVASKVMAVQQFESEAKKSIEKAQTDINEKKLAIIAACKNKSAVYIKSAKQKLKGLFTTITLAVAAIDTGIAYSSYRTAGFSTIQSASLSAAVFILLVISTFAAIPWIKQAKTTVARSVRGIAICSIVFSVLAGISFLRAEGLNNIINISTSAESVQQVSQQYSFWPLLLVSFGLFLGIFLLHLFYWQDEREKEQALGIQKHFRTIEELKKEIALLDTEIIQTEKELTKRKDEVRALFDLYHKLVKRAENIGEVSIGIYKRTFSMYAPTIPDFLQTTHHLTYDTEIKFYTNENK
jgi:uncharacterized small protein (DUF1192 family)